MRPATSGKRGNATPSTMPVQLVALGKAFGVILKIDQEAQDRASAHAARSRCRAHAPRTVRRSPDGARRAGDFRGASRARGHRRPRRRTRPRHAPAPTEPRRSSTCRNPRRLESRCRSRGGRCSLRAGFGRWRHASPCRQDEAEAWFEFRVPGKPLPKKRAALCRKASRRGRARQRSCVTAAGRRTVKRAPALAVASASTSAGRRFSAQILPPCASTICREIERPRPEFWPKP